MSPRVGLTEGLTHIADPHHRTRVIRGLETVAVDGRHPRGWQMCRVETVIRLIAQEQGDDAARTIRSQVEGGVTHEAATRTLARQWDGRYATPLPSIAAHRRGVCSCAWRDALDAHELAALYPHPQPSPSAAGRGLPGRLAEPRILIFDIETAPARMWGHSLWDPVRSWERVEEAPWILGVGLRWLTADLSVWTDARRGYRTMLTTVRDAIAEADVIVGMNSARFDLPWLEWEWERMGIAPPPPTYRHVDLLKALRKMKPMSRSLGFTSHQLGLDKAKGSAGGFGTWRGCMRGFELLDGVPTQTGETDVEAWRLMARYCRLDVDTTTAMLLRLLPRLGQQLGMGTLTGGACSACGSDAVSPVDRPTYTPQRAYRLYKCEACGTHLRSNETVAKAALRAVA